MIPLLFLAGCSEEITWSQEDLPNRTACIDLAFYASSPDETRILDIFFVDDPVAQAKDAGGFLQATYDLSDPADGLAVTVNGTAQLGEHLEVGCSDVIDVEPVLEKEFQVASGRIDLSVDATGVGDPYEGGAIIDLSLTDAVFRRGKRGTLRLDSLEEEALYVSGPAG